MTDTRWDLCLVPTRRAMQVSPQGVHALVRWLIAGGYLTDVQQTEARGWTELHGTPGGFAHALCHEGSSTGVTPVFFELGIRFGPSDLDAGYGLEVPVHFLFELRGAAFDRLVDDVIERVDSLLYVRPELWRRPHQGLRPRDAEGAPDPPSPRRADRVDGRIGTRVEEL